LTLKCFSSLSFDKCRSLNVVNGDDMYVKRDDSNQNDDKCRLLNVVNGDDMYVKCDDSNQMVINVCN